MDRSARPKRTNGPDRAVSTVVGAALLILLTMIVMAIVGATILGYGQGVGETAPSVSMTVFADTSADALEVYHKGGDTLQTRDTKVQVRNESSGNVIAWNPVDNGTFAMGDVATVSVADERISVDGTVVYGSSDTGESSLGGLTPGHRYEVLIIDTESQRIAFGTTFTA